MNRNSLLACASVALSFACGSGVVPSGVAPGTVAPDMGKKIFAARSAGLTKTQREGIYNHCEYDLSRFCPEILPTDVNFFRQAAVCLSDHGADLTDDCSAAFQAICGDTGDLCDFDVDVAGPGYQNADGCKVGQNFFDHKCYAACAEGLVFYQGHCLNLKTDPNNCGEINNRCDVVGGDPCYNGECLLTCPADVPEATDCAGTCTDLSSDYYNCGACGKSCGNSDSVNRSCQKSVCVTTCGGKVCTAPPNSTPTCENDIQITAPVTPQICGFTCDSGYVKNPAGTACVKASSCDPLTEVSVDGHCYYLDGSAGKCDAGYTLGSESVLSLGLFAGKTYKHTQSNNCCITTSEPLQNFGMGTNCNQPGLFGARDPEKGAHGCTAQVNRSMHQLTLCGR